MPEWVSPPAILAAWALAGYLIGSIPFGLVFARAFGLGDLRRIGSGNIGATNVLRTGDRTAAALTLVCDSGKGAAVTLAALWLAAPDAAQLTALGAFLGHCFPLWLGFRGGKGVATFLGVVLVLAWPAGLATCATWLASAVLFRYSSLAALAAATLAPVWMAVTGREEAITLGVALAALLFLRHQGNIRRLAAGSEPRIGRKR